MRRSSPELASRLVAACHHAGFTAEVAGPALVYGRAESGEVRLTAGEVARERVTVRLRHPLAPLDARPGAARDQARLALRLNAELVGARCVLDAEGIILLHDDVLAPVADVVSETACRLRLLRGQVPWVRLLLDRVAEGLSPEAALRSGIASDEELAVAEVERWIRTGELLP